MEEQPKLTPEQQKEMMDSFKRRSDEMNEKVQYWCEKLKLGLSAVPAFTQDGRVVAQPIWIDASQKVEPTKLNEG